MTTMNTRPLRSALLGNAGFSLASGAIMVFRPAMLGDWLGVSAPLILQIVGGVLCLFSADLFHQATRGRMATWRALYASAGDLLWVVGTFGLLALYPNVLSQSGTALVLGVALVVFGFGLWQIWGIIQAHKLPGKWLFRHCILVKVNVSADAIWRVVGQLDTIKDYMPSLKQSALLDDKASEVGAVRVCEDHAGKRWAEECIAYEPGRGFDVRFVSEADDFPFPAKSMRGGWEVQESEGGSVVMVWWELEPTSIFIAPIVLPILAFQVDRQFPQVVQRMAAAALGRNVDAIRPAGPGAVARMLPNSC